MPIPHRRFLQRLTMTLSLALCMFGIPAVPALAWEADSLSRLQTLADKGNAEAQYHVGMVYSLGVGGVSEDPKRAFEWFQKSADGKYPLGVFKVGTYYAGQFPGTVAVDVDKAFSYKLFSAKAGYVVAQAEIGNTYYKAGDYLQAEKWWKLAADQGYPPAANNLSVMYSENNRGPRNAVKAYTWFKTAYAPGQMKMHPLAQDFLDALVKDMKPSDIEAADKQVSRWKPKPSALTAAALAPIPSIEALLKKRAAPAK